MLSSYQRFLEGKSSEEELRQLFKDFGTTDEATLRVLIKEAFENTGTEYTSSQPDKFQGLFQKISDRIDDRPHHKKTFIVNWRIAASIAATLIIAGGYYLWSLSRPVEMKTVTAAYGKRVEVFLPDSSEVWLNSGSTLQYPVIFQGKTRLVTLKEGEAFFVVTHDAHKPFVVQTGKTNVSVLGTSFEIAAFTKEPETLITVSTGKVGVVPASSAQSTFLLPGERAILDKATNVIRTVKVDMADIAVWRQDRLLFDDQPLATVMASLERKYNVRIEIKNSRLLNEKVTMRLGNQPLDNVLTAISFSNHFTFKKINEQLIIVN